MELKKILKNIDNIKAKGNLDVDIKAIESNSKNIIKDSIFFAIKGFEQDGTKYIKNAVENGAIAIVIEEGTKINKNDINPDTIVISLPNIRESLAKAAANFYNNPSTKFNLIGVTGTKGKTTTTFMIKTILEKSGQKVGLIGTIANYIGDKNLGESTRTTPDAVELQKLFAEMVKEKVDTVVIEVSSQSLKLHRVDGSDFDIGVFTNFSEDHISPKEHPNMEDYFESKLKLFNMCKIRIY